MRGRALMLASVLVMVLRRVVAGACVIAVMSLPTSAFAVEPEFGARGQVVLSSNANARIAFTAYQSNATFFSGTLAPSLDYFVARDVSLGLDVSAGVQVTHAYDAFSAIRDTTSTSSSALARVGFNVRFGRWITWWPRVNIGFDWSEVSYRTFLPTPSTSQTGVRVVLYAPLLFHLRSHFLVGFGPSFSQAWISATDVGTGTQRTSLGLSSMVGGYFGGAPDVRTSERIVWRRFGQAGQFAIDGSVGGAYSFFEDTTQWSGSLLASAGFDYFVIPWVSVGLGISLSYVNVTGIDFGKAAKFTNEQWSLSLAPRVGVNIPMSDTFSFYPRAALGFGAQGYDTREGSGRNTAMTAIVFANVYAPILLHVAPHFFVGFGPYVTGDIVAEDVTNHDSNRGIEVGGLFTLGGWLTPRASKNEGDGGDLDVRAFR